MPGLNDKRRQLLFDDYVYGREKEASFIQTIYEQVKSGNTASLFIMGYSGVGKTTLATKILKPLAKTHGFFISGKYDALMGSQTQMVIAALSELVRYILSDPSQHEHWKHVLNHALEPNTHLMIDLIPELEGLLGKQRVYTSVDSEKETKRIAICIQSFIQCFAKKEHPLVILLDDLHRASTDELNLIEQIISSSNGYLMVVGAFRDNECPKQHPLHAMIHRLDKQNTDIHSIDLMGISDADTKETVYSALNYKTDINKIHLSGISEQYIRNQLSNLLQINQGEDVLDQLSEIIYKKTHGNPFFIRQMLLYMKETDIITFNEERFEWEWSIDDVLCLSISDNVAVLAKSNLSSLPEHTLEVLKVSACLGVSFELKELAIALGMPPTSVLLYVWPAEQQQIIANMGGDMTFIEGDIVPNSNYAFLHDKLHEASYKLIEDDDLPRLHLANWGGHL